MSGERALGLIGQNATYSTTGPTVTLGTALAGYRTAAQAVTASDLADGQRCTVLIQNADLTSRAVWAATYDNANGQFDQVSEILLVGDAFEDTEAVTVRVVDDGSPPALYTPAISTGDLVLDCGGYHQTYHRVTLDDDINGDPPGITLANAPSTGVIELTVEFRQSGGPHAIPEGAWAGVGATVEFDTVWNVLSTGPTVAFLRSTDGGTSWRIRNNTPASALDLADYGSGSATDGQVLTADGSGGAAWEEQTGGAGTVTSVAVSGSDGIEVDSGSPITSSGTIALGINASTLRTTINVEDGATADQTAQEIATAIDADATAEATLRSAIGVATTSNAGLVPTLSNSATQYLSGVGTWATPDGTGTGGSGEVEVLAPALTGDGLTAVALDITGFGFTASSLV